jgi:hypothetical protein
MARIRRSSIEDGLRQDIQAAIDATIAARNRGADEAIASVEAVAAYAGSMRRRGLNDAADKFEKDYHEDQEKSS